MAYLDRAFGRGNYLAAARRITLIVSAALYGSLLAAPADAATITVTGVAVSGYGSNTPEGLDEVNIGSLGGLAIPYFIPLSPGKSGVYGQGTSCSNAGIGTCSDSVKVGWLAPPSGSLSMYLSFSLAKGGPSTLSVLFDDLDLLPGNDPNGFSETVRAVFKTDGTTKILDTGVLSSVGGSITDIGDALRLDADLGTLTAGTHFLLLKFSSTIDKHELHGTLQNTVEHLIAQITTIQPNEAPGPVPLPGAVFLFGAVVAGSWGVGAWRRRRQAPN